MYAFDLFWDLGFSSSMVQKAEEFPDTRLDHQGMLSGATRVNIHEVSLLLFCMVWIGKRRLCHSIRKLQCCARVTGTEAKAKAKAKNTQQFLAFSCAADCRGPRIAPEARSQLAGHTLIKRREAPSL